MEEQYEISLGEALSEFEAAVRRTSNGTLTPIHPVKDFEKMCVVFCMWKRVMRGDERAISMLSVAEARLLFLEFTIEFNNVRLPIEFYRAFPEASEVGRLPQSSALRRVLEATNTRDLFAQELHK